MDKSEAFFQVLTAFVFDEGGKKSALQQAMDLLAQADGFVLIYKDGNKARQLHPDADLQTIKTKQ